MLLHSAKFAFLLVLAEIAFANINGTIQDVSNKLDVETINKKLVKGVETRKKGKSRSTSSSSGERKRESDKSEGKSSLELSTSSSSSSLEVGKNKRYKPQSSLERRGWRKWHRKCPPCPEEMAMAWRNPRVKWICGAYQRARRSFKSLCMMHFRNCQDGTMFTKIHDHRCENSTKKTHGDHFFYDYKVRLLDESSSDKSSSDTTSNENTNSDDIFSI